MTQGKERGFRARMPVDLCLVCHSGSALIRGQPLHAACKVSLGGALDINVLGQEGALRGPGEAGSRPVTLFQWKVNGPCGEF